MGNWGVGAILLVLLGVASAGAAERAETATVVSPHQGLIRLDVFDSEARVVIRKTIRGHGYIWAVRDGRTGPLLQGPDGVDCPRYRQFVHQSSDKLLFGWNDPNGRPVAQRWLARSCFKGGKTCRLHDVDF